MSYKRMMYMMLRYRRRSICESSIAMLAMARKCWYHTRERERVREVLSVQTIRRFVFISLEKCCYPIMRVMLLIIERYARHLHQHNDSD